MDELLDVLAKIAKALKAVVFFMLLLNTVSIQVKEMEDYFTDLNKEGFEKLISEVPELTIQETAILTDIRLGKDESWLNVIVVKHKKQELLRNGWNM